MKKMVLIALLSFAGTALYGMGELQEQQERKEEKSPWIYTQADFDNQFESVPATFVGKDAARNGVVEEDLEDLR